MFRKVMGLETEHSIYVQSQDDESHDTLMSRASDVIVEFIQHGRYEMVHNEGLEFIGNGSRIYVDLSCPELSTPECTSPLDLVAYERAGTAIVWETAKIIQEQKKLKIDIYRKNSDGLRHTYGCHENYSISPELFEKLRSGSIEAPVAILFLTFACVRQLLCGAGKVGSESSYYEKSVFQLSQRADFIESPRSDSTTSNRPIIQTRNEALADDRLSRRFHYIAGDTNICETPVFLKVGLTALMLELLESQYTHYNLPVFSDPYACWRLYQQISHDPLLVGKYKVLTTDGDKVTDNGYYATALEILGQYLKVLESFAASLEYYNAREGGAYMEVIERAKMAHFLLGTRNYRALTGILDWVTKRNLLESYLRTHDMTWDDCRNNPENMTNIRAYADMRFSRADNDSLYGKLCAAGKIKHIVSDADVEKAKMTAPAGRPWFRTELSRQFGKYINMVDWDSVTFSGTSSRIKIEFLLPISELYEKVWYEAHIRPLTALRDLVNELEKYPEAFRIKLNWEMRG